MCTSPVLITRKTEDEINHAMFERNHLCQSSPYTEENIFEDENVKITSFITINCNDNLIVYMVSSKWKIYGGLDCSSDRSRSIFFDLTLPQLKPDTQTVKSVHVLS